MQSILLPKELPEDSSSLCSYCVHVFRVPLFGLRNRSCCGLPLMDDLSLSLTGLGEIKPCPWISDLGEGLSLVVHKFDALFLEKTMYLWLLEIGLWSICHKKWEKGCVSFLRQKFESEHACSCFLLCGRRWMFVGKRWMKGKPQLNLNSQGLLQFPLTSCSIVVSAILGYKCFLRFLS